MPPTLGDLRSLTLERLGDTEQSLWTADEIDRYLREGYQVIAQKGRVFWDELWSESLPPHFSVTQPWELAFLDGSGAFDFGVANYTYDDERLLLDDEDDRLGPAWYTSPYDATLLDDVSASVAMSGTVDLPESVAELDRLTWNNRAIDATTPRDARAVDSRYELTAGDVYAYTWRQDGVRTLRKIRVPAQIGDTYTVTGSWGIARDLADIADDTASAVVTAASPFSITSAWEDAYYPGISLGIANFTDEDEREFVTDPIGPAWWTSAWEVAYASHLNGRTTLATARAYGIPRQITGEHPMGSESFGTPRRFFQDGMNVRIEHFRQGRPMDSDEVECELPTRYAWYLMDFAQQRALSRPGAGQDMQLAGFYAQLWARDLARIARRTREVETQRTMGLRSGQIGVTRPPSPSYPWNYGVVVR